MLKTYIAAVGLALASITGTSSAFASVIIYDNFSEDPNSSAYPYTPTASGYGVQWQQAASWGYSFGAAEAMPFTVPTGQDVPLESVSLAMYKWPSGVAWDSQGDTLPVNHDNLTVEIVKSAGDLPSANPSDVVEVLSVNPVIPEDSASFLTLTSASHPILDQGQTYWVIAEPTTFDTSTTNSDTLYLWVENTEGALWNYTINEWNPSYNNGAGGWQGFYSQTNAFAAPSLEVLGVSDVPEPASLAIFGAALVGLGLMRRRQREDTSGAV